MAYYRLSQVIKMRRKALGMKRNDFDEEGTSFMTVYRMETGKVRACEKTYRKVTRVMGEEESTRRGILKTKDVKVLRLTNDVTDSFMKENDEKTIGLIKNLERMIDCNVVRNRKYLDYINAKLQYRKGEINDDVYADVIKNGLSHSGIDFDSLLERNWPFLERECNQLIELAKSMRGEMHFEMLERFLNQIKKIVETEYMEVEFRTAYIIWARFRITDALGNLGYHRKAIELDEETCLLGEEKCEFRYLAEVYYDIFWNYWILKKKETLTKQEEARCKECLLKAYYINKAWYRPKELYARRIRECYPEEIV